MGNVFYRVFRKRSIYSTFIAVTEKNIYNPVNNTFNRIKIELLLYK